MHEYTCASDESIPQSCWCKFRERQFGECTLCTYFSLQAALHIICEACKQRAGKALEEIKRTPTFIIKATDQTMQ